MLTTKIIDRAWDATTFTDPAVYSFFFPPGTIDELVHHHDYLESILVDLAASRLEMERFPSLQEKVKKIKYQFLEGHSSFCLVDGLPPNLFTRSAQRGAFYLVGRMLGTPLVQNKEGEILVEVSDKGQSMKTGGRYHDTREGGSLHTDSPQFAKPPDYLGLLCYHPAKRGGKSKLVSAYTIHNYLLEQHSDLLPILYQPFHIDKRGDFKQGESPTTFAPIFTYEEEKRKLTFRYLRDYIDQGHERVQQPLTVEQRAALDALDALLEEEALIVQTDLQAGHMMFNNNMTVIHGRTAFEDWPEAERKRIALRLWIRK